MIKTEKNSFKIAIFFSILWHTLCLSIINIVIVTEPLESQDFSDITFLGPILGKTAFEMMADGSMQQTKTLYRLSTNKIWEEVDLEIDAPQRLVRQDFSEEIKNTAIIEDQNLVSEHIKVVPEMVKNIYYNIDKPIQNSDIEGPAKKREIVFRPDIPVSSHFKQDAEENLELKYKIVLSKDGVVDMVIPIKVSSDPKITMMYTSYIKR
ncbi:MAG: hypothetical protein PHQ52_00390, partial [Candidatus Omnitrophica bacterium]|nr:hypothetical protein [Candidatus Omnitrophota bacterium]